MATITVNFDATDHVFTTDSAVSTDATKYGYQDSTLVVPRHLLLKRVYPKRTKTYIGNARNELRLSFIDEETRHALSIFRLDVSRQVDFDAATFALQRKIMASLIVDTQLDGFFTSLSLP
jgi:hypothetical protein